MNAFILRILLTGLLILPGLLKAEDDKGTLYYPVTAENGMVVTRSRYASEVGVEILKKGGNAVDAAVAVGFALAVTLPQAGNLGGGGFMVYHEASSGEVYALDFREVAPALATEDMFVGPDGKVDETLARASHQSAGVPGSVAGMHTALDRFGSIPLAEAVAPAITLAERGFVIPPELGRAMDLAEARLRKWEASKAVFFRENGLIYQAGDLLVQKDLARTLKTIAEEGKDGFYQGRVAGLITAEMERHGGLISKADLAAYKPVFREPVRGTYRGLTIYSMPPPSSGGVHLVQLLNILEGFDLGETGHNSAAGIHRMAEAMRRAFADRSEFLGDPGFVEVPIAKLTSKDYAERLRESISPDRASASKDIRPGELLVAEGNDTTAYCVIDKDGNAVSVTTTLNTTFGAGIMVTGAGFLLNNEMDDFSAQPGVPNQFGLLGGKANAIAPGKRMLSSMTPTIVVKDGKPVLLSGAAGGARIITAVLQIVCNVVDHDLNVQEAINAPRVHHQWYPDELSLEKGVSVDTIRLLEAMGHEVVVGKPRSNAAAIYVDPETGRYEGAADPRREGVAAGY